MINSQNSNNLSPAIPAQLLEVESQLATQEAELTAQLESIQEKRKSLQIVIGLFGSDNGASENTPASVAEVEPSTNHQSPAVEAPAPEATRSDNNSDAVSEATVETPAAEEAKSSRKSPRGRKPAAKSAAKPAKSPGKPGRKGKQGSDWQQYVRPEFGDTSLPEAISSVLNQQPDEVVGVPELVDTIFEDETPKVIWNQARDRISNALSVGVKNNKWYRGKTGHYSLSQTAAAADLAS